MSNIFVFLTKLQDIGEEKTKKYCLFIQNIEIVENGVLFSRL
jgi:hypothetical protein